MTKTRIYLIRNKLPRVGEPVSERRLIRAANSSQALGFAARSSLVAELASQDGLIEATQAGVKVEDSVAED